MKKTWEDQLNEIVVDNLFGTNIVWEIDDIKEYLTNLSKLGAYNIEILDYDSIRFELPEELLQGELLLFILTSGKMPTSVSHKKESREKHIVQLNWDF